MPDFTTIVANNLSDVTMIAGDEQTFEYYVWDNYGNSINLQYASTYIVIFKYGEINNVVATLSGSWVRSGSSYNLFSVKFSGSLLPSGIYQQQVKILDAHGGWHVPSQGRIIIFDSPTTGSYYGSI